MSTTTIEYDIKSSSFPVNLNSIPEIKLVEEELFRSVANLSPAMQEICVHIINSGGKRLRPLLLFYSGMCFGQLTQQMIKAAAAAELIHLASLVHDDIIDNSSLRHGRVTINSKDGNLVSVLAGDYLFAKAFEILCSNEIYKGMGSMVKAIQNMCEGEILQAEEIKTPSFNIEEYLLRIEKKTAKLISSCCETGASIATSDKGKIESMKNYGMNLGYAFQIVDDILDLIGDSRKLGKPVFNDLLQGNATLPVLFLRQYDGYSYYIDKVIKEKTASLDVQLVIRNGLLQTGALNQSYLKAVEYCNEAKRCLIDIPDSLYKQFLLNLTETILSRCN